MIATVEKLILVLRLTRIHFVPGITVSAVITIIIAKDLIAMAIPCNKAFIMISQNPITYKRDSLKSLHQ